MLKSPFWLISSRSCRPQSMLSCWSRCYHLLSAGFWSKSVMSCMACRPRFSFCGWQEEGQVIDRNLPGIWPKCTSGSISPQLKPAPFLIPISLNIWSFSLVQWVLNCVYKVKQHQQERFGATLPHHSTLLYNDWWRLQRQSQASALTQMAERFKLGLSPHLCCKVQAKGDIFLVLLWAFSPTSCSLAGFDGCVYVSEPGSEPDLPGNWLVWSPIA